MTYPHLLAGWLGTVFVSWTLACAPPVVLADHGTTDEPLAQRIAVTGVQLEEAREVFGKLQSAVRADDRAAVSALVAFPLEASVAGTRQTIRSRRAFEQRYDSIICKQVRDVILAQKFDSLFANWKGLMIGRGEVWLGGVCEDAACGTHRLRIIAVNGPFGSKCPR